MKHFKSLKDALTAGYYDSGDGLFNPLLVGTGDEYAVIDCPSIKIKGTGFCIKRSGLSLDKVMCELEGLYKSGLIARWLIETTPDSVCITIFNGRR